MDLTTSMTHRGIILGISFSFGLFSIVLTDGLFSTVEKKKIKKENMSPNDA